MQEFIDLANHLADEAGNIAQHYFRRPFEITQKDDESPVTIADKTIELRLREIIEKERPEDGIWGEEFENKDGKNDYTWVIDPIDGTKPFTIGRPTFGTLIALCKEGAPILGVIDQVILGERWVGVEGQPTTFNGTKCKTRSCNRLTDAICVSTAPGMFDKMAADFINQWREACRFIVWGGDCISYGLMALGHVDAIIEAEMQPHDYLALVPIIEGAGGKITDWQGKPLTLKSGDKVVAIGDPALWDNISDLLD